MVKASPVHFEQGRLFLCRISMNALKNASPYIKNRTVREATKKPVKSAINAAGAV